MSLLLRTEGIVLRNTPFGEADLIVTFLTLDYGLIKTFAKSPRKIKSRFGSSLEPFTCSEISFWGKDTSNLPKLTQSDIIRSFQGIRENMECLLKASEVLELSLCFLPEREPNKEVFFLLKETLHAIEGAMPPLSPNFAGTRSFVSLIVLFYKVKFLHLAGYAPGGHRPLTGGGHRPLTGGGHRPLLLAGDTVPPSRGALRLYESLSKWDASKLNRIKPSERLVFELSNMLDAHIKYTLSN